MNDDELKALFDTGDAEPRKAAQQAALAAALQAFDAAQAEKNADAGQGFAAGPRLTPERQSLGRKIMNVLTAQSPFQRWAYSGMASAAVLILGVFLALQLPRDQQPVRVPTSDTAAEPEAAHPIPGKQAETREIIVTAPRPAPAAVAREQDVVADAIGGGAAAQVILLEESVAARDSRATVAAAAAAPQTRLSGRAMEAKFAANSQPASLDDSASSPFYQDRGRDRFEKIDSNPVKRVAAEPVSTFSIDVDTAAYSFIRRQLNGGVLPQKAAVRIEEMVNYFPYDYPLPQDRGQPFSTDIAVIDAPWKAGNKLVRIGIQGYELQGAQPRSNLVFLLDVSGSMNSPDKLPLVKQSMNLLLSRLQPEDTVSIVVYAGAAGSVLEPTPVRDKQKILDALNRLQAGGSTAGGAGIQLAYQQAQASFVEGGVNRIILATDGDFNVGINDREELQGFIERKRESGVYLSVLGFGQGNYNDALMQALAQNGNGVAAYIDTLGEAQKVLVDEATSALFPIARDVKIQVEFNPATVSEYRLLGYESRILAEEDFNNDAVDAGDIGAGHRVTALYEITPAGQASGVFSESRYVQPAQSGSAARASEYGYLKLRYKLPDEAVSKLLSQPIAIGDSSDATSLRETRFAAAVAGFGELLRGGKYSGGWDYADALALAQANRGDDPYGYRSEFVQLVRKAETASGM
ncbi:vWA domain-containing protein [Haliea sp. E17]|uniref:vWA domain-containing protein n=1 Tax=Haliea sp. E17 TaxID=3401576 RepID=UPI003AAC3FBB